MSDHRFNEQYYLANNPDVADAVRDGRFASGWQHYERFGKNEGRAGVQTSGSAQSQGLAVARYWQARQSSAYLQHVKALVSFLARDAASVIDVGSNGCPYLNWFPWVKNRVSLDLQRPFRADGITSITADLFDYEPQRPFDMCLCLQVLEHVHDAGRFAQKLAALAPQTLISVPYRWPVTSQTERMGHIHDPVDENKVASWFGRAPDFQMISSEVNSNVERMICYYKW